MFKLVLSENSWHLLNQIIYDIYSFNDLYSIRKKFLENIRLLVPYDKSNFFIADIHNKEHFIKDPVSVGFEESDYEDYYMFLEKSDYNNWMYATAQNEAFILSELLSDQEIKDNIFAREWLIKKNIPYVLILSLSHQDTFVGAMSLFRAQCNEDFTLKEKKILNILKRHLSLQLYTKIFPEKDHSFISESSFTKITRSYALTARESDILKLLLSGTDTYEICSLLHISESTMRKHTSNIYKKLDICKRSDLNKIFF